jgi:hypothetical protein
LCMCVDYVVFYGLNYAFAYACLYDSFIGNCTWYLVPCNELSLSTLPPPPGPAHCFCKPLPCAAFVCCCLLGFAQRAAAQDGLCVASKRASTALMRWLVGLAQCHPGGRGDVRRGGHREPADRGERAPGRHLHGRGALWGGCGRQGARGETARCVGRVA